MRKAHLHGFFILFCFALQAQKHDASWVLGGAFGTHDNLIVQFDSAGLVNYSSPSNVASVLSENASVSDAYGNLLFFTNGIRLFDRNMDTIPNGELALPISTIYIPFGLDQRQGCMFLPWPGDTNLYALLHTTYEYVYPVGHPAATGQELPLNLYLTVLDKNMNNGLGGVVYKNVSVLNDTLTRWGGGLSVTKHANGRDWWIVMKKHYRNRYHKLLLTPSGVQYMGYQLLGPNFRKYAELLVFSPDGQVLAAPIGENTAPHPLAIMDFDRCSGMLSNFQIVNTPPSLNYGCNDIDFSPNSRYLYANEFIKVFQFDLQNRSQPGAVQNSMVQVADTAWTSEVCDSGFVGYRLTFCCGGLAPDSKVYYFTNSSCNEFTYFEKPDSAGLTSSMNYTGISLPVLHVGAVPYFPNYRLGPLPGSGCDSLTSVHELQAQDISLYPNPASDRVQISASRALNGAVITLFNVQGQQLLQQTPGFGTTFEVQLPGSIQSGIYFIRIQSNEGVVTKKVVLRR